MSRETATERSRESEAAAARERLAADPSAALVVLLEGAEQARAFHTGAERRIEALAAAIRAQSEVQGDQAAALIRVEREIGFVRDIVIGVVDQMDPVRRDIDAIRADAAERDRRAAEKHAQLEKSIAKLRRTTAIAAPAGAAPAAPTPIPIEVARASRPGLETLAGDLDTAQRNALTPEAAKLLIDAKLAAQRNQDLEGELAQIKESSKFWRRHAVTVAIALCCTVTGGAAVAAFTYWLNRPPPAAETKGSK